ncbi:HEPN domain-containing protein [Jiulongibacter sediminis]|uniref:Nitrite reductase n=1 Tax=Jiulongibacter sediminis TaxID=1605367 RepID=A0A0P7CAV9_9BACT|nr:HEPN domain-containing protein [Jiulongibacter sediminis]KPM49848.1 nitrite reductase [Jiulongibacter sediminis]TBX26884.1 nitrite reductase [Jiulongibacter sediminis]
MQSFRTELENPLVEKDIIDLEKKIRLFKEGKIDEEKFRSLRLARGVYGQRQQGVQMIRIKLPYGKMTFDQWRRICDVCDEYSTGNLHFTTRQDIQIHYVSLDSTPELWSELERDNVTLREACGNTVRNVTASVTAGVDKGEAFDVTPYAHAFFQYFLRNPICQEMGRKIKVSFSNTDEDTSLAFMHDMGFIPRIKDGERGFKVVVGGGLGAQPRMADVAYEFLHEDEIIPFAESVLRVFDRHGERNSRSKARMKFLLDKIGLDEFMSLLEAERASLKNQKVKINTLTDAPELAYKIAETTDESEEYKTWLDTNVIVQKQEDLRGVYVRVPLGNISTTRSREILGELEGFIGNDIRVTINQGLFLRNVPAQNLAYIYQVLKKYGFAGSGANSVFNITACPGTDTCNLAISDSTSVTKVLEETLEQNFPQLVKNKEINIKISGCMNSCGQHGMANIGFHGSSIRTKDKRVMPALQVLLGGGALGSGEGRAAEKVIKVPSKRGPQVLISVLGDYEQFKNEGESFNDYYDRQGKIYFYDLLKPLAELDNLQETDFVDWGRDEQFKTEIGVGECASVIVDLVGVLFLESEEKIDNAKEAIAEERYADGIYHIYAAQVNAAKALLLDKDVKTNTQMRVIAEFDENYKEEFGGLIAEQILGINKNEPSKEFALDYLSKAESFIHKAIKFREESKSLQTA